MFIFFHDIADDGNTSVLAFPSLLRILIAIQTPSVSMDFYTTYRLRKWLISMAILVLQELSSTT